MHPNPLTSVCGQAISFSVVTSVSCCALQDAVPVVTFTSQHSAIGQGRRPAPSAFHSNHSGPSKDTVLPQQLSDWAQRDPDLPVHAISLLHFSPSSSSSRSSFDAGTNQRATVPDLVVDGGCGARRVLAAGVMKEGGEFDRGCWDAVSVVKYPSRAGLRHALMSEVQRRQLLNAAVFAVLPSDDAAAKL